jgi:poly(3-hydroxybutyrate) depolymerase
LYQNLFYAAVDGAKRSAQPFRLVADFSAMALRNPLNPWSGTYVGKTMAAAFDVFESFTRNYAKPEFNLPELKIYGQPVTVTETYVWQKPFGRLKHFAKDMEVYGPLRRKFPHPKVLIVAPLSGHFATLLRGTVEAMLPEHDVYISDWTDAREVPLSRGRFGLDEYIEYLVQMTRHLGPGTHLMAVCQPGPAALAAASLMHEDKDPAAPRSLTIMGSPIDARLSPTAPNKLSEQRSFDWFEKNMIHRVPLPYPGHGRLVYPGFLQLTAFINMNRERHTNAQYDFFKNLVKGDGDSVQKHRDFYDEYLAVLDLPAEFYLETIDKVFQRFLLADGKLTVRGRPVKPAAITDMGLMTVEGEKDDISGIGQTQAAHALCSSIPDKRKMDYIQPGVGHYGVFNGTRWRTEIQPRVRDFIRANM